MRFLLYNMLLGAAALFLAPYYGWKVAAVGKYRRSMKAKFGFNPPELFAEMKGAPRIWVHAVSVGEVSAAKPIVEALRLRYPGACIVLSTSTETGRDAAERLVPGATAYLYYPLDIPWVIGRVVERVLPDVFVPVETEIWPNFIRICRSRGIGVVMVNGRISPRSFTKYRATKFFWKEVLESVDALGVISETDAARLEAIGVPPDKISIMGNAKYDSLAGGADPARLREIAGVLSLSEGAPVLVAGSTHDGEEKILFSVFKKLRRKFPDLLLLIVPRHIDRAGVIRELAAAEGLDGETVSYTDLVKGQGRSGRRIVIVDAMGVLFTLYGCAHVVYCGGSLVLRGGQNVLEAAAWGKVVLFGPHMDDFAKERDQLLAAGAGMTVTGADELAETAAAMLADPDERKRRGEAGKKVMETNRGAAERYAGLVASVLANSRPSS